MGKYLDRVKQKNLNIVKPVKNYILEEEKEKVFSQTYGFTNPQKVQKVRCHAWKQADDARAAELLMKYRRGGAHLELETINHAGALWISLAVDLSRVRPEKRDHAFAQIERHAREIQSALNAEARASAQALAHERARRQIEGAMPPALLTQWRAFSEADRHAEARALALLDAGIDPARAALS